MGSASPASAHSGLVSSDPADGAQLDSAPSSVTMAFTEPPDLDLSSVTVLDAAGADLDIGPLEPGEPARSLRFTLPASLGDGVYTVSWSVVSQADGHLTVGVVAFGGGRGPRARRPAGSACRSRRRSRPLAVAGKVLLYVGLVIAVGAAAVGLGAFQGQTAWSPVVAAARGCVGRDRSDGDGVRRGRRDRCVDRRSALVGRGQGVRLAPRHDRAHARARGSGEQLREPRAPGADRSGGGGRDARAGYQRSRGRAVSSAPRRAGAVGALRRGRGVDRRPGARPAPAPTATACRRYV